MFIQYKYILDVEFCQEKKFAFGKLIIVLSMILSFYKYRLKYLIIKLILH